MKEYNKALNLIDELRDHDGAIKKIIAGAEEGNKLILSLICADGTHDFHITKPTPAVVESINTIANTARANLIESAIQTAQSLREKADEVAYTLTEVAEHGGTKDD